MKKSLFLFFVVVALTACAEGPTVQPTAPSGAEYGVYEEDFVDEIPAREDLQVQTAINSLPTAEEDIEYWCAPEGYLPALYLQPIRFQFNGGDYPTNWYWMVEDHQISLVESIAGESGAEWDREEQKSVDYDSTQGNVDVSVKSNGGILRIDIFTCGGGLYYKATYEALPPDMQS